MSFVACRKLCHSVVASLSLRCHPVVTPLSLRHHFVVEVALCHAWLLSLSCHSMSSGKGWINRMWFTGALPRPGIYFDQISTTQRSWKVFVWEKMCFFSLWEDLRSIFCSNKSTRHCRLWQQLFDQQYVHLAWFFKCWVLYYIMAISSDSSSSFYSIDHPGRFLYFLGFQFSILNPKGLLKVEQDFFAQRLRLGSGTQQTCGLDTMRNGVTWKGLKGKRRGLEMCQTWLGNHNILIALLQASSMWASL